MQCIERYSDDALSLSARYEELEKDLDTHILGDNIEDTKELISSHDEKRYQLEDISQPVFLKGEELIQRIQDSVPRVPPVSVAAQELSYMESVLNEVRVKYNQLVDMWEKRRKELVHCLNLKEFELGFHKVSG